MRWGLALVAVVALSSLAACDPPAASTETACSNVCSCAQDPFQEHECNRQCVAALGTPDVPQACKDCLHDSTCELFEQGACAFECNIFSEEYP